MAARQTPPPSPSSTPAATRCKLPRPAARPLAKRSSRSTRSREETLQPARLTSVARRRPRLRFLAEAGGVLFQSRQLPREFLDGVVRHDHPPAIAATPHQETVVLGLAVDAAKAHAHSHV